MNTSGRYRIPPHNSSANASPTGRYQVGAPAHAWEAADDLSRSKNATKKITANSNCLCSGARLQFRGSREVPPGRDGKAGLFESRIIRVLFIVNRERDAFQAAAAASTECPRALGLVHPGGSIDPDPENLEQSVITRAGFPLCLSAGDAIGFNSLS